MFLYSEEKDFQNNFYNNTARGGNSIVKLHKKGKLGTNILNTAILAIVILVVLFSAYAAIIPEAQTGGDDMGDSAVCTAAACTYNASGSPSTCQWNTTNTSECPNDYDYIPLSNLFAGTGVVFVVVMAALLVLVVRSFLKKGSK